MRRSALTAIPVLALAACGGDGGGIAGSERTTRQDVTTRQDGPPARSVGPPPDAGTPAGHGADPGRVAVPESDHTPPSAVVSLRMRDGRSAAEAAQPGDAPDGVVRLDEPRVLATTVGNDADSGVVRVRVSLREEITCRDRSGRTVTRPRTRYVPRPQVGRITARPGFRIPTRERRSVALPLSGGCPRGATALRVEGELWGEAVNGLGLEAVTPQIRFAWTR